MDVSEVLTLGGEGMNLDGTIERCFGADCILVNKDGVVVGLDHTHKERESGQQVLDEVFRGLDGHFFAELDEAQTGAAIDSGVLIEFSPFDEIG